MEAIAIDKHPLITKLDRGFILSSLSNYNAESICIESGTWDGKTLQLTAKSLEYPFTKKGYIDYVTGAMSMLYLSQAGYVNAHLLVIEGKTDLTEEEFFVARDNGQLLVTRVSTTYRNKIYHKDGAFFRLTFLWGTQGGYKTTISQALAAP